MKVGFTGTRNEITCEQHHAFCAWLKAQASATEFHHGCCVGADSEALEAVDAICQKIQTHAHPPTSKGLISRNSLEFSDVKHEPVDYLDRNRAIVNACDVLAACPEGPERVRSGTWSTIRYAKKCGKPVVIFHPDGTTEERTP